MKSLPSRRRPASRNGEKSTTFVRTALVGGLWMTATANAFTVQPPTPQQSVTTRLWIYAPPGSGYASLEDEQSRLPDTYEPMMEYPGTMRPGRTPENMPFHDLPLADDDPDPVPWPHFQQIEWHHQWDPPHEHPVPMEDFIEQQGRWATPEMEAAMRAGVRQSVRERREEEEAEKRATIITDDDEDEDEDETVALGEGVFGSLGSTADQAMTAAATAPTSEEDTEQVDEEATDDGLDDFLLDLGLDLDLDDDEDSTKEDILQPKASFFDDEEEEEDDDEEDTIASNGGTTATINVDDDDTDLGLDEDDELEDGVDTVPLEDFGDSDTLDTEDIFDEGGFDFDDDVDFDGGDDMW